MVGCNAAAMRVEWANDRHRCVFEKKALKAFRRYARAGVFLPRRVGGQERHSLERMTLRKIG
jgi:hypothetical protein